MVDSERSPLFETGQAAWPGVALSEELFFQYLDQQRGVSGARRKVAGQDQDTGTVSPEHAPDLYIACACLHRVPRAIEEFEKHYMSQLRSFLARAQKNSHADDTVEEICQVIRDKLFVAPKGQRAKIADYAGRGSLRNWLRMVALRVTASFYRSPDGKRRNQTLDEAVLGSLTADPDPELGYLKERYAVELKSAFQAAFARLPAERTNILRLYLADGLSMERIGALFHVHRSTVMRWIDDAREQLLTEARQALQPRINVSPQEFESLIGLVRSELDLSINRILKTHTD